MHVSFVIAWPGKIPAGQTCEHPVSALDVATTAAALAGIKTQSGELDGVNLIPHLTVENRNPPHEFLAWRWNVRSAIRGGNGKLLRKGERECLYNLAAQMPEVARRLRARLKTWCDELDPPGLANGRMALPWNTCFDSCLEGKAVPEPGEKPEADAESKAKRKAASQPKPEAEP